MTANISFRPQTTMSAPVVQQSKAESCKEELNRINADIRNNRVSDIAGMTQRMQVESELNDTKVPTVKYVEEIKPQQNTTQNVSKPGKPQDITDVIKKFHKSYQSNPISNHDYSQMMTDKMNQLAISNRILHGLF